MSKKELKCSNCGSIVYLDNNNEQNKCIFCWADLNYDECLKAAEDPNYKFENISYTQPPEEEISAWVNKYRGNKNPHQPNKRKTTSAQAVFRKENKVHKESPKERVARMNMEALTIKFNKKILYAYIISSVCIFVLLAVICLPLAYNKYKYQKILLENLQKNETQMINWETSVNFSGLYNSEIRLVSHKDLNEKDIADLWNHLQKVYASVYGEEKLPKLKLEVLTKTHSFSVYNDNGKDNISSSTLPKLLKEQISATEINDIITKVNK